MPPPVGLRYTHVTLFCSDLLFNEMCDYKDWDNIHVESTRVARGFYDFDPCRNCTQSVSFLPSALYMHMLRYNAPVVVCLPLPLLLASTFSNAKLYIRVWPLYVSQHDAFRIAVMHVSELLICR